MVGGAGGPVARMPYHRFLGIQVEERGEGRSRLSLPFNEAFLNDAGVIHGGVLASFLDAALAAALVSALPPGGRVATVQLSVTYAQPVRGALRAEGRTTYLGGRLGFAEGEIFAPDGSVAVQAIGTYRLYR